MTKVTAVFSYVTTLLATYPALSAALLNFAVVAAAFFGLHVTGEELVFVAGVVTMLFGALVHSNVSPLVKLKAAEPVIIAAIEAHELPKTVA